MKDSHWMSSIEKLFPPFSSTVFLPLKNEEQQWRKITGLVFSYQHWHPSEGMMRVCSLSDEIHFTNEKRRQDMMNAFVVGFVVGWDGFQGSCVGEKGKETEELKSKRKIPGVLASRWLTHKRAVVREK